jgi:hypothetical protein
VVVSWQADLLPDPTRVRADNQDAGLLVNEARSKKEGNDVNQHILAICFDQQLKLRLTQDKRAVEGSQYDRLYCWSDDHWYDLLSLLGERYVLYGWWNEGSHQLMATNIFDQKLDVYVSAEQKNQLLIGHRYIVGIAEKKRCP